MKTEDYDVVIIGAGPAGCATALALQGSGLRVALIDKEIFPRDKICGDAIPGASFKAMDAINTEWGKQMRQFTDKMDVKSSIAYFENNKPITYNWFLYSYNSKRIDFDYFLLELVKNETTTTVIENKRLLNVNTEVDSIYCEFEGGYSTKAAIVIGCDGANSIVKKQLNKTYEKEAYSIAAIRAYYKDIAGIKAGENEIHIIKGIAGYFWIFPLENGWANVGFGVVKDRNNKDGVTKDFRNILKEITDSPVLKSRFENATLLGKVNGFGLPIWTQERKISGDRYMLCGDAAYLIDPLQGHGIDTAMWSGVYAAKQVIQCYNKADFSIEFMQRYDSLIYNKIGKDLAKNYYLAAAFYKFPFLLQVISKLNFNQKVVNWLVKKLKI